MSSVLSFLVLHLCCTLSRNVIAKQVLLLTVKKICRIEKDYARDKDQDVQSHHSNNSTLWLWILVACYRAFHNLCLRKFWYKLAEQYMNTRLSLNRRSYPAVLKLHIIYVPVPLWKYTCISFSWYWKGNNYLSCSGTPCKPTLQHRIYDDQNCHDRWVYVGFVVTMWRTWSVSSYNMMPV